MYEMQSAARRGDTGEGKSDQSLHTVSPEQTSQHPHNSRLGHHVRASHMPLISHPHSTDTPATHQHTSDNMSPHPTHAPPTQHPHATHMPSACHAYSKHTCRALTLWSWQSSLLSSLPATHLACDRAQRTPTANILQGRKDEDYDLAGTTAQSRETTITEPKQLLGRKFSLV